MANNESQVPEQLLTYDASIGFVPHSSVARPVLLAVDISDSDGELYASSRLADEKRLFPSDKDRCNNKQISVTYQFGLINTRNICPLKQNVRDFEHIFKIEYNIMNCAQQCECRVSSRFWAKKG